MAERKAVLLRLDPAVHDALARWAADDMRSVNAQIVSCCWRIAAEGGAGATGRGSTPAQGPPTERVTAFRSPPHPHATEAPSRHGPPPSTPPSHDGSSPTPRTTPSTLPSHDGASPMPRCKEIHWVRWRADFHRLRPA
jgi:hypothetical protein